MNIKSSYKVKRKTAKKQKIELKIIGEVEKLKLKPDELLIITSDNHLSQDQCKSMENQIKNALGGRSVNGIVILHSGLKFKVLNQEKI